MEYFIEKTLNNEGRWSVILVNSKYEIVEEVALFLNYLEIKQLSINTINNYCQDLKVLFNWLEERNMNFYEVKKRDIISLITFIQDFGKNKVKSPTTINRYLASYTSFYRYYEGIGGHIMENPLTIKNSGSFNRYSISKHKTNASELSFFRQKETKRTNNKRLLPDKIQVLFQSIEKITNDESVLVRKKLLFRLLYETGLRIGECLGLRIKDYSEPTPYEEIGYIYIVRYPIYHKDHSIKTNERNIPVSMDLIYEIDGYICDVRPQTNEYDTIFVNHRGVTKGKFMIRDTVGKEFRELSEYTNIRCTPHTLRHTHGTELSESGYNQEYIRSRLGHASIESTSIYMHISLESQTNAYEKFMSTRKGNNQNVQ